MSTKTAATWDEKTTSKRQAEMRFRVQALSNVDGWQTTKYGGRSRADANRELERLASMPERFCSGIVVPLRVVEAGQ